MCPYSTSSTEIEPAGASLIACTVPSDGSAAQRGANLADRAAQRHRRLENSVAEGEKHLWTREWIGGYVIGSIPVGPGRTSVKRLKPFKLFASATLLCLLVAAEAMAVVHSLDFEAHAAGESCKICISVAGFGSAAPARVPTLLPPPAAAQEAFPEVRAVVPARIERPAARGPPIVS
jgi:hypothetical protein